MIGKKFVKKYFSVFNLEKLPEDPIFGIMSQFNKDPNPNKISLTAGTYKTDENKPYILNCVRKAQEIINDKKMDHEYLGIEGLKSFVDNSLKVAYTDTNKKLQEGAIAGIQTISGTGALYVGFKYLADYYKKSTTVLYPNPTWPNHPEIVKFVGLTPKTYRYYDLKTQTIDINGLLEDLHNAPEGTIVLLHSVAHNPTGLDPTQDQWLKIFEALKKKKHLPFFDNAYQGFATGDLDKDGWVVRHYAKDGNTMLLSQSFAKNFGLYGQRAGCFSVLCQDKAESELVMGCLKKIARRVYSNPPKYGAQIVDIVLSDPSLYKSWKEDLVVMSSRMNLMRKSLHEELANVGSKRNWDHIKNQIGMFAYTGLNKEQVLKLRKEESLYFTDDGRISISGLNTKNVRRVAECFHKVSSH